MVFATFFGDRAKKIWEKLPRTCTPVATYLISVWRSITGPICYLVSHSERGDEELAPLLTFLNALLPNADVRKLRWLTSYYAVTSSGLRHRCPDRVTERSVGHAWRPRPTVGVRLSGLARPAPEHSTTVVVQVCRVFFEASGWGGPQLHTSDRKQRPEVGAVPNLQSSAV